MPPFMKLTLGSSAAQADEDPTSPPTSGRPPVPPELVDVVRVRRIERR